MYKTAIVLSCLLFASTAHGMSSRGKKPKVEVCGIRIVAKPYKSETESSDNSDFMRKELRAFHSGEGTAINLLISGVNGGIIKFDKEQSELDYFRDNKNTDLTKSDRKNFWPGNTSGFGAMNTISLDGKAIMLEVSGPRTPAKGAKEISAKGKIILQTASKKKTIVKKSIALKKGSVFKVGKISFLITKTGKPQWGNAKMALTLQTEDDIAAMHSVIFKDAEGRVIKSNKAGSSSMGMGNEYTYTMDYNLKKSVSTATIEFTIWQDMKLITIPFSVKTSIGLQ